MKSSDLFQKINYFLSELEEGEPIGFSLNSDTCSSCRNLVNSSFHFYYSQNVVFSIMYCEKCNKNWSITFENIIDDFIFFFLENKELYFLPREQMFFDTSIISI